MSDMFASGLLQVAAAYQRNALLRDRATCDEMQAVLLLLKVKRHKGLITCPKVSSNRPSH